ncbi:tripartite tricarboxylate transporter permease [Nocardiopsis aegyptia]|uniref:Putative tricarboxylic transport membrane protein n=1 Tax=Nocardiopsis aegyptia TaxID=220378 RepID=A0A7Z0J961_9ACTN|nr:tripartite tricarboxylate transporter permease [Nocardiopsis aegyptia]NYJ33015.1 putative tricarboxylic transport membrane protein [Nocardiopsis aegyptia]
MGMLDQLMYGFGIALTPENLLYVFIGVLAGTIIGMLPGLGPMSAIALMIPIAYGMDPTSAIIMLAGVYYGAIFGGSTSSILLNAPGVAGTVATSFDGYPMALKGQAGKALAIAAICSFVGGTISVVGLMAIAPSLASFAVSFGPVEYFALMVLGLTAVVSLGGRNLVKGLVSAVVGVMIALVGIDSQTAIVRFTFDLPELYEGVEFLIVALGVFALAEVLVMLNQRGKGGVRKGVTSLRLSRREIAQITPPALRSSVLGFFTGVLPGAGATVASFLSYSMEKKIARDGDTFGEGNPKGVAAPEAANNAAAVGSFVPLMTLGVPGSGTTAILLGALMVLGVQPGPMMLSQNPDMFWGVVASMYIGSVVLLILNLPLIPLFAKVLNTPRTMLVPLVVVFCVVGVYGLSFSVFDLGLLAAFGAIGFLMRRNDFPAAPLILGLILGGLMETNMRRALQISDGAWSVFLTEPISAGLLAVAVLSLLPALVRVLRRRRTPVEPAGSAATADTGDEPEGTRDESEDGSATAPVSGSGSGADGRVPPRD